jgi:hypothetical protein
VRLRTKFIGTAVLACLIAVSSAAAAEQPFKVTSTLDHKTVLPLRIHWVAVPNIAAARVSEVDFLIDGRLGWVEHRAPYVYGDDGNWLVTSFLRPGLHTFTVRVITISGRRASDTVRARVVAAPAPPAQLAGQWQRTVTAADVTKATSGSPPPAGTWGLTISARGWAMRDPQGGGGWFDVAYPADGTLQMRPTIERPPYPNGNNGGFCADTDPLSSWKVAVSADGQTMTLNPSGSDPCGDRVAILQGTWRRVAAQAP